MTLSTSDCHVVLPSRDTHQGERGVVLLRCHHRALALHCDIQLHSAGLSRVRSNQFWLRWRRHSHRHIDSLHRHVAEFSPSRATLDPLPVKQVPGPRPCRQSHSRRSETHTQRPGQRASTVSTCAAPSKRGRRSSPGWQRTPVMCEARGQIHLQRVGAHWRHLVHEGGYQ